jgi:hypothetical protein
VTNVTFSESRTGEPSPAGNTQNAIFLTGCEIDEKSYRAPGSASNYDVSGVGRVVVFESVTLDGVTHHFILVALLILAHERTTRRSSTTRPDAEPAKLKFDPTESAPAGS